MSRILVCKFHDVKSDGNLRIEQQVKSNCARQLDEEDGKGKRELIGLTFFIDVNSIAHASKHYEDNSLNTNGSVQHLGSLFRVNQEFLLVLLQVGKNTDDADVHVLFFNLENILVSDVFLK